MSEELSLNDDFFSMLSTMEIDDMAEKLAPVGIKTNVCYDGRVHFEVNTFDTSIKPYLVRYQCRGMVVDSMEKTYLALPPPPFRYYDTVKQDEVRRFFNDGLYKVIKANDGTNITLYNFNGEIYASSAKSPDISNYYWQGDKTFSQMFYEVAEATNPKFIEETELKISVDGSISWNIPKDYSITIGFRHHNIHPDTNDPMKIWLVRCINRNTLEEVDLPQLRSLEKNIDVSDNFQNIDQILSNADQDIMLNHKEQSYGYILVSKNPSVTRMLSHVFIPSSLYKLYQHFFYAMERNKDDEIKHNNRYLYSLFRNILANNTNYLKVLSKLLPKYDEEIQMINVFIDEIISNISLYVLSNSTTDEDTSEFTKEILKSIKSSEADLDIKSTEATKLISDYVRSIDNTAKLTQLYINKNK